VSEDRAAAGDPTGPAGDGQAHARRDRPPASDQAPSPARNALEEFFASAFVRIVTGLILLDWIARRLVAWLSDRLYVVADRLTAWLSGPGHHYVDAGYPRLPEAVALVVVPTLLYLGFVRLTERRRVSELGGGRRGALEGLAGLGLGAGLFALIVAVLAVAGAYDVLGRDQWAVVQWSVPIAAVAFREELLYRGVIQRVSEERLGTWLALAFASAWFGFQHADNPNAGLFDGAMIALFGGVLLGACFLATRRLWLAIGVHAAWNFVEGGVFGTPVSGYAVPGVLRSYLSGPERLTGGPFGPESSLVTLAVCSAASAGLLVVAWRRGSLRPPRLRSTGAAGTSRT
jgi:membrane protease YdiL (CAAX protease family)